MKKDPETETYQPLRKRSAGPEIQGDPLGPILRISIMPWIWNCVVPKMHTYGEGVTYVALEFLSKHLSKIKIFLFSRILDTKQKNFNPFDEKVPRKIRFPITTLCTVLKNMQNNVRQVKRFQKMYILTKQHFVIKFNLLLEPILRLLNLQLHTTPVL
jgi:hypothetical protein